MPVRARNELFREFEKWGFDEKGWSPRTRETYSRRARNADAWLVDNRGVSLLFASPKDLQAYLFSTPPTARNRNNLRQALVGFGAFAVDRGLAQVNSALGLPRLPEPVSIPKALEGSVAQRIDVAARTLPLMERCLVLTFLYAGLRKSEARLLEWSMFDEGFTFIRFAGKRGRIREVPIHEVLQPELRLWRSITEEARWVFPSPRRTRQGHPISDTTVRYILNDVGDLAGIRLHPHLLRHTVATAMLEAGGNLREVQEFLGHSDPKTTSVYTRVRPTRLAEAVGRIRFRVEEETGMTTWDVLGWLAFAVCAPVILWLWIVAISGIISVF